MRGTGHYTIHYVVFSTPLLPRPSLAQIFSSAPYFCTRSSYISPSVRQNKFHTHTKQQEKLYFNVYVFGQQTRRPKILDWLVARECTIHLLEQFIFLLYAYIAQRRTISPLTLELHAWCTLHKTQFKWPPLLCIYLAKTLLTFLFLSMSLQVVCKHQRVNSQVTYKKCT